MKDKQHPKVNEQNIDSSSSSLKLKSSSEGAKKSWKKLAKLGNLCVEDLTKSSCSQNRNNNTPNNLSRNLSENEDSIQNKTDTSSSNCDQSSSSSQNSFLSSLSASITNCIEDVFESHGRNVATWPRTVIGICLLVTLVCSLGLLRFHTEHRPLYLWLSKDSQFLKNLHWQIENFPDILRYQTITWEADNVLTAATIREMWNLHSDISQLKDPVYGVSWADKCSRIPSLIYSEAKRKKRSSEYEDDASAILGRKTYCESLNDLPKLCLERSLLEVWGLNESLILNLTDEQVLKDVNEAEYSEVFGYKTDFKDHLGGIQYDNDGNIISAATIKHIWVSEINKTAVSEDQWSYDPGNGQVVDLMGLSFENSFLDIAFNYSKTLKTIKIHPNSASSFGTVSEKSLDNDVVWISLGFMLMIIFVSLNIGKRNFIEQRIMLSMAGIFGIALSISLSYGLSSLFGVFYSPVNSILPALMIGLGVDDMFVIMASWKHIATKQPGLELTERMALTMRQAGVAITVTSVTDVVAFAVGATTSLPALRSFCIYAAIGIMSVYAMQITFFLAFLIFDEKRIKSKRYDVFSCIQRGENDNTSCSQASLLQYCMEIFYGSFILSKFGRPIVLICSFLLFIFSAYSISFLHQNFDHMNFIPQDSYLYQEYKTQAKYFPEDSNKAMLFFKDAKLPEEISNIQKLLDDLGNLTFVTKSSDMFKNFDKFYTHHPDFANKTLDKQMFYDSLSLFLNSRFGAVYRNNFLFDEPLNCKNASPPVTTFRIHFSVADISSPEEQKWARAKIRDLIEGANITGFRTSLARNYISWETNEIVAKELRANMIMVLVVIYVITLVLLASFWGALMVFGSVAATMTCIGGLIWVWNVAVDTVSCIGIVLSVGLSVDYAVHVVHMFLSLQGLEPVPRVQQTMLRVGSAVFQGGLSTLITFLMMAPSESHVFVTFFKIFVGSAVFGLYWGLVVLPVVLSFTYSPTQFKTWFKQMFKTKNQNSSKITELHFNRCLEDSVKY